MKWMFFSFTFSLLLLIRNRLHTQKLVDTPLAIEATESTGLGSTVRQCPLVMHSHGIDVDGSVISFVSNTKLFLS